MFSLLPYLWGDVLFAIVVLPGVLFISDSSWPEKLSCSGPLLVVFSIQCWRHRQLWRLAWELKGFRTKKGARIVLHYAPELQDRWNFQVLLQRCETELDDLSSQFGCVLRGRATILLLSSTARIGHIFGSRYGGYALFLGRIIVVADDCNLKEFIRHELAHLFAARWNTQAPPILAEGLPTWLQGSEGGLSIERAAAPFLRNRSLKLDRLLKSSFFFSEQYQHACYILAGSFTGFLIRRFGWDKYRKFYRRTSRTGFKRAFQKFFGMSLAEAECGWRNEWLAMEVLNRRMRRNLLAD